MGNLTINEVRAKLLLPTNRPYFASAAMSLRLVETPGLGTMAVDKEFRLYYDPAVLIQWSNAECVAVFEHEMMHTLRAHSIRQEGRQHTLWNICADMEINDDPDLYQRLPAGCMHPSTFQLDTDKTAEEYFDALQKEQQDALQKEQQEQGGERGVGNRGNPTPDCGSGAGGDKREWEISDGNGVSPLEAEAIRRQTAESVRAAGNAPGNLKRWAEQILTPPRIPWSKLLPAAIRTAVAQGTPQRYRYPSRRETGNLILPRLISGRPSAALVVDTSGSITDADLALAIALTRSATKHADLAVYACDTEAHRVPRLTPGCLVGGGGTDMREGIRTALEGKPKPHAVVVITDCYSPWNADPPAVPVVILTANPDQAPRWAKVIQIEGEV